MGEMGRYKRMKEEEIREGKGGRRSGRWHEKGDERLEKGGEWSLVEREKGGKDNLG